MLEVLQVVLYVEVVDLGACPVQELVLPLAPQQRVELDVLQLLELRGIYKLDVSEGQGHFAFFPHPLLLLLHRDDFAMLELPLEVLLLGLLESSLLPLSCPRRLLVIDLDQIVNPLAHNLVLEGVLVVARDDLLVDGL